MKNKTTASVDESDHETARTVVNKIAHDHKIHHYKVEDVFAHPLAGWLMDYYDRCRRIGNTDVAQTTTTGDPASSTHPEPTEAPDAPNGGGTINSTPSGGALSAPAGSGANAGPSAPAVASAKDRFIAALQNYGK